MSEAVLEPVATAVVGSRAAKRLRNFYTAVYRDELVDLYGSPADGDLVLVQGPQREMLGTGFYSRVSRIAVRLLASQALARLDGGFFRQRLRRALARRAWARGLSAFRVAHAEADGLPGLVVDSYGGHLVVQCRAAGMERCKPLWVEALADLLSPASIFERSDMPVRDEEGLPRVAGPLWGETPARLLIEEHGLRYLVDVRGSSKTGFYLDQRDARWLLRQRVLPGERVLDLFSFTGGFALNAAAAGASALAVEWNGEASELARENARLNGLDARVEVRQADAFTVLAEQQHQAGFDWVVADPPALAKSAREGERWQSFLVKLAADSLRVLRPGGRLFLFSCAYHLGTDALVAGLRIAGGDLGRRLFVLAETRQAADHPWLLQIPETLYLKGVLVEAE